MASEMVGIGEQLFTAPDKKTSPNDYGFYTALSTATSNLVKVGASANAKKNDRCGESATKRCCKIDENTLKTTPPPGTPNKVSATVKVNGGGFAAGVTIELTISTQANPTYTKDGDCAPPTCKSESLEVDVQYTAAGSITLEFSGGIPGFLVGLIAGATVTVQIQTSGIQKVPLKC